MQKDRQMITVRVMMEVLRRGQLRAWYEGPTEDNRLVQ